MACRIMSMKNSKTPSGIESATFRVVAQCIKQLPHRVPLGEWQDGDLFTLPEFVCCVVYRCFVIICVEESGVIWHKSFLPLEGGVRWDCIMWTS